jgi:hypothetical protein
LAGKSDASPEQDIADATAESVDPLEDLFVPLCDVRWRRDGARLVANSCLAAEVERLSHYVSSGFARGSATRFASETLNR